MHIAHALQRRFAATPAGPGAPVRAAADAKHGDYQMSGAMALAKQLGRKPQDVAAEIAAQLPLDDVLEPPAVAGPGFINLRLRTDWLERQVLALANDDRLGVEATATPRRVVVDYSGPNVAKPLHVGHLRSTIIGDCLVRLLRFLGHRVEGDNHLGDWGTQFGILLYGYKHHRDDAAFAADPVRELNRLYLLVRGMSKAAEDDEGGDAVAEACRAETAKLHAGDAENVALWRQFMPACMEEIHAIYRRLGVRFDHILGESFYNPLLPTVVEDLLARGIARESQGAVGIFRDDQPDAPPSLIRKRDGAFTYTTTDLATIRYRLDTFGAEAMLYVVDARQGLHFTNLFAAAKKAGCPAELTHIAFGSVLGNDKKPLKTRDGTPVELAQLLDESIVQAAAAYEEIRDKTAPPFPPDELQVLVEMIGIGAVKYADLCQHRTTDYMFAWSKMLAMDGNTAAYSQYAHARCRSILRRSEEREAAIRATTHMSLSEPAERTLALQLLRFEEALTAAAAEYLPHVITAYLWDTAKAFSVFNQQCHVLKAATPELRASRLLLCDLTARVIAKALDLLGIAAPERM